VSAVELLEDGSRNALPVPRAALDTSRAARWRHVSTGSDWVTRIGVETRDADGGRFVARVPVGPVEDVLQLRVSLGRE